MLCSLDHPAALKDLSAICKRLMQHTYCCRCHCDAMEAVRFHSPSYGVCHERWRRLTTSNSLAVQ